MNKINWYIFNQIVNSCTLIFFIFVSIAWLLQLSRLFNVMNNLQIKAIDIIQLSFLIIPNLINVTLPFVFIFGFVLAFVKFSKDKELVAIYSLGLSLKEITKPIILLISLFCFISLILNFILSPNTYSVYKEKEYELRNSIEFNKINISNFIKFSDNLTIDFENDNQIFKNILINIKEENEIFIYAKNGQIDQTRDKLIFNLNYGFKAEIENNKIETLKFDSYVSEFPIERVDKYSEFDPNTLNVFELMQNKDGRSKTISFHRIIDTLIILSLCFYFYYNIIVKHRYELKHFITFIIIAIISLTIDNVLENFTYEKNFYLFFSFFNILFIHFFTPFTKIMESK